MPAREMYFTFDTKLRVNRQTVSEFVDDFSYYIKENFVEIKKVFGVTSIDQDFLKMFIKELKAFDSVSVDRGESFGKQKIIKEFIYDMIGDEVSVPTTVLGIKYLYDVWDYEGCGNNDHYYLTYADDRKLIKLLTKEANVSIDKLRKLGVDVKFEVK